MKIAGPLPALPSTRRTSATDMVGRAAPPAGGTAPATAPPSVRTAAATVVMLDTRNPNIDPVIPLTWTRPATGRRTPTLASPDAPHDRFTHIGSSAARAHRVDVTGGRSCDAHP